jgi:putative transposase
MTSKAKKGKRKKQKAGLNKSILDVGFGMLRSTIKYKVEQIGGVFTHILHQEELIEFSHSVLNQKSFL